MDILYIHDGLIQLRDLLRFSMTITRTLKRIKHVKLKVKYSKNNGRIKTHATTITPFKI